MNEWPVLLSIMQNANDRFVSDSGHQYRDAGNGGFPTFAPTTCRSGHDNKADIHPRDSSRWHF